jgi:hypothetical protein
VLALWAVGLTRRDYELSIQLTLPDASFLLMLDLKSLKATFEYSNEILIMVEMIFLKFLFSSPNILGSIYNQAA